MSTSTETTLRNVVIGAIQGIAHDSLGFDDASESVKSYLLDYEPPEKASDYLTAKVATVPVVRKWAVEVLPIEENLTATGKIYYRLYQVLIRGYYDHRNGDEVNTLVDHARAIRGAVKALDLHFSHTVDLIESIEPLSISLEDGPSNDMLVGDIVYRLRRENPDF